VSNPCAALTKYELRHLPAHLTDLGWWEDLRGMLSDPNYVVARVAVFPLAELVACYRTAGTSCPAGPGRDDAVFRCYGQTLSRLLAYQARTAEDHEAVLDLAEHAVTLDRRRPELVDLCRALLESLDDWNVLYGVYEVLTALDPADESGAMASFRRKGGAV
jgi:hypothetical protein